MLRSWTIAWGVAFCAASTPHLTLAQDADPADTDAAIDWPMFQGNMQRTGVCDYPPIEEPTIAWSAHVGIMGYLNNPVIHDDRVYVGSSGTTHNTPDDMDGIYCLDLNTGEIIWHRPTDTDACGVAINATHVFAGDDGGLFQAIDRETGEVVWTLRSGSTYGLIDSDGEMVAEYDGRTPRASIYAQPLLLDDLVVIGDSNGLVYAVETATGAVAWAVPHWSPNPGYEARDIHAIRGGLSSDGELIFGVLVGMAVFALDTQGEERWSGRIDTSWGQFYGAPTVADGVVYYAGAGTRGSGPPIVAHDAATGEPRWNNMKNRRRDLGEYLNIRTSPAYYDGVLFYAETESDRLVGVDADTGRPIWQDRVGVGASLQWASPVIAEEMMYLARPDGVLYALLASDRTPAWSLYLGDHALHGPDTPAAVRNHTDDWRKPPVGDSLYATPAIARDGTIVVGSGDGWLYCIREAE